MRNILFATVIWISSALLAIGGTQDQRVQSPAREMNSAMKADCPLKMAGVDLSIEDTNNGIRLTFTTRSGDVDRFRGRLEAFAKMHSSSESKGMRGTMMPFFATYEAVMGGARITLTPRDPLKLEEFRAKVREHLTREKHDACPMMETMMPGMMRDMKHAPDPTLPPSANPAQPDHGSHHPAERKQ
jgi:hypothetical protein